MAAAAPAGPYPAITTSVIGSPHPYNSRSMKVTFAIARSGGSSPRWSALSTAGNQPRSEGHGLAELARQVRPGQHRLITRFLAGRQAGRQAGDLRGPVGVLK